MPVVRSTVFSERMRCLCSLLPWERGTPTHLSIFALGTSVVTCLAASFEKIPQAMTASKTFSNLASSRRQVTWLDIENTIVGNCRSERVGDFASRQQRLRGGLA